MSEKVTTDDRPLHPGHHWGPFASDPWSPDLDLVTGEAWEALVEQARRIRLNREHAERVTVAERHESLPMPK
ncbi:hypothetical protein JYK14_08260 [Siccirubricoccus sp. KC 17139]|uniref:Uncharacterized protein n=1 Tax=Siccirubricoccus soli TaxID=2899147 RepID=A0ABT1D4M3_9PROT|nr:hypothetical protein [Siccirubricoccus soli]MCO6416159.1 hypothetical protein [Siccirubricoccus soli]MCP2682293.1 hypothetical protein [Siccirubricoccus soli]